ncbi:MAG: hypothetical protein AAGH90_02245 [Pseudomonadota bacterium]
MLNKLRTAFATGTASLLASCGVNLGPVETFEALISALPQETSCEWVSYYDWEQYDKRDYLGLRLCVLGDDYNEKIDDIDIFGVNFTEDDLASGDVSFSRSGYSSNLEKLFSNVVAGYHYDRRYGPAAYMSYGDEDYDGMAIRLGALNEEQQRNLFSRIGLSEEGLRDFKDMQFGRARNQGVRAGIFHLTREVELLRLNISVDGGDADWYRRQEYIRTRPPIEASTDGMRLTDFGKEYNRRIEEEERKEEEARLAAEREERERLERRERLLASMSSSSLVFFSDTYNRTELKTWQISGSIQNYNDQEKLFRSEHSFILWSRYFLFLQDAIAKQIDTPTLVSDLVKALTDESRDDHNLKRNYFSARNSEIVQTTRNYNRATVFEKPQLEERIVQLVTKQISSDRLLLENNALYLPLSGTLEIQYDMSEEAFRIIDNEIEFDIRVPLRRVDIASSPGLLEYIGGGGSIFSLEHKFNELSFPVPLEEAQSWVDNYAERTSSDDTFKVSFLTIFEFQDYFETRSEDKIGTGIEATFNGGDKFSHTVWDGQCAVIRRSEYANFNEKTTLTLSLGESGSTTLCDFSIALLDSR